MRLKDPFYRFRSHPGEYANDLGDVAEILISINCEKQSCEDTGDRYKFTFDEKQRVVAQEVSTVNFGSNTYEYLYDGDARYHHTEIRNPEGDTEKTRYDRDEAGNIIRFASRDRWITSSWSKTPGGRKLTHQSDRVDSYKNGLIDREIVGDAVATYTYDTDPDGKIIGIVKKTTNPTGLYRLETSVYGADGLQEVSVLAIQPPTEVFTEGYRNTTFKTHTFTERDSKGNWTSAKFCSEEFETTYANVTTHDRENCWWQKRVIVYR